MCTGQKYLYAKVRLFREKILRDKILSLIIASKRWHYHKAGKRFHWFNLVKMIVDSFGNELCLFIFNNKKKKNIFLRHSTRKHVELLLMVSVCYAFLVHSTQSYTAIWFSNKNGRYAMEFLFKQLAVVSPIIGVGEKRGFGGLWL